MPKVGANAFALARTRVDQLVRVPEDLIALAILRILELEKDVVEGAAAATLAAFLSGQLSPYRGRTVVLVFAGGNVDPLVLSRVIEKGLVADGRRCRFTATISDRPGGLAKLTALIAGAGANITEIIHERAFSGPDVSKVNAICTVETRDAAHMRQLHRLLVREKISIRAQMSKKSKRIVVTGVTRGLGRALARYFAVPRSHRPRLRAFLEGSGESSCGARRPASLFHSGCE